MTSNNIFSGLKVLDLASFIAGPAATTVLSDFGAEVIKIEPPGMGDPYRFFYKTAPNPTTHENYAWHLTNRNKRGMALDLKSPSAAIILERLVKWADVLVTNFPHPVRKKLKLTFEDVGPWNPRLIYADITGYGDHGPDADLPGFDITAYWARSGLMAMTRDAGGAPTLPIPGIGDHATAISLYSAIVTALYRRERTGAGSYVTTSLVAEGAWAAATWIQGALCGAKFFPLHDRMAPPNPVLNPYQTADDRWFLLVVQEKDWATFAQTIGHSELVLDERFNDGVKRSVNSPTLTAILDATFRSQSLAYWREIFDHSHITYGIVQTPSEVIDDPQLLANDIIVPIQGGDEHLRATVSSPMKMHGVSKEPATRAPELGEHNQEVLRELGFDLEEVETFKASGVIPNVKHSETGSTQGEQRLA
ncbi:CaiB/BaiF CoA transferase family protein [Acidicapsa ligni]|uniref:CaiB/BaiF CoA transferase family protein n=1 Tax=Acidicapsa ligni TaxID=542300 RepID=UPI0021E017F9|nr:CoA transferase [Acidicapsa ligni]